MVGFTSIAALGFWLARPWLEREVVRRLEVELGALAGAPATLEGLAVDLFPPRVSFDRFVLGQTDDPAVEIADVAIEVDLSVWRARVSAGRMLNGNMELRFPLVFGFGAAIFLDGGGAFLRNECTKQVCNFSPLNWEDFRKSAGLGLRYLTPVGPISLEYGFKIDRRTGESIGAFHFTIGNIF